MQKPSGKRILFLTGILALMFVAFLMGGITLSSAGAISAQSVNKTPPPSKSAGSKPDNMTKGAATITRITGNKLQATLLVPSPSGDKGSTVTILLTGRTTYDPDRSIVAVGKNIAFAGTVNRNGSVTAQVLAFFDPTVSNFSGVITNIDGSTVTLQEKDKPSIIHLTASTIFLKIDPNTKEKLPASQSDLKVGVNITAEGKLNGDGSLAAQNVVIIPEGTFTK